MTGRTLNLDDLDLIVDLDLPDLSLLGEEFDLPEIGLAGLPEVDWAAWDVDLSEFIK